MTQKNTEDVFESACSCGKTAIASAARILVDGGIVAFPTETVYGLGANAFDATAAARVFDVKNRPAIDPLIVHVATLDQVMVCTTEFPDMARRLAEAFWPGPLTLVLRKTQNIPDLITAGLPTVALRMPNHPVPLELIQQAKIPIAAPSANPFGALSPTTAKHVENHLGQQVDAILDGGPCTVGVESTIVSLIREKPVLLRPGGTSTEDIEKITGPLQRPGTKTQNTPSAPGQLPSHYAPNTPLFLVPPGTSMSPGRTGLLAFTSSPGDEAYSTTEILSPTGDFREAAANLFAALHRLDSKSLDAIVARPFPERGLGAAINDRLRRAAAKSPPLRTA